MSNEGDEFKIPQYIKPIPITIDSLSPDQKTVLNNLIESQFRELSVRSKTALNLYFDNDLSLKTLIKFTLEDSKFNFEDLPNNNINVKEINSFLTSIKNQIEQVSNVTEGSTILIELVIKSLKSYFEIDDNLIKEILKDHDLSTGLPIFKIIKGLIDNDIIFNKQERLIFYSQFCQTENNEEPLVHLANKMGLSKERVRQIKLKLLKRLDKIFRFTKLPEIKTFTNYGIDLTSNCINIPDDLVHQINSSENTNFNQFFIVLIFAIMYEFKYEIIGQPWNEKMQEVSNSDKWKNCYLIDKNITSSIDFNRLIDDIKNKLSSKIEEDLCLNFQKYLLNFMKTTDIRRLDLIAKIAEYILFNEFELTISNDGCLIFLRNTKVRIIEYVYDALEKTKRPLTIYELYQLIEKAYPGVTKSVDSLRGSCQGDPNLFFIGRSSTYGLKKWEDDLTIKGGTIRDIVEEYLQTQSGPKHISEITKFVNKFRKTNAININSNLRLDKINRFIFFSKGFIGLNYKNH